MHPPGTGELQQSVRPNPLLASSHSWMFEGGCRKSIFIFPLAAQHHIPVCCASRLTGWEPMLAGLQHPAMNNMEPRENSARIIFIETPPSSNKPKQFDLRTNRKSGEIQSRLSRRSPLSLRFSFVRHRPPTSSLT